MGDSRGAGRAAADLGAADVTGSVRAAYEAEPRSWAAGPEPVYAALAGALVAHVAPLLSGAPVLDLGAGTGVAGRAALAAGAAEVAAADLAIAPLRRCAPPLRPVGAEATALPFRDQSFAVVLAAFSLTHAASLGAGPRRVAARRQCAGRQRVRAGLGTPGQGSGRRRAGPIRLPPARLVPDLQARHRATTGRHAAGSRARAGRWLQPGGVQRARGADWAISTGAASSLAAWHGAHRAVRRIAACSRARPSFGGRLRMRSAAASR